MIKVSELRKGNFIKNPKGEIIIVASIADGVINESYEGPVDEDGELYRIKLGFSIKEITPIALTVEWLARLGFEWNATDKRYYIQIGNTLYLEFDTDFDFFITPESWGGSCPWSAIKHIHQLQNIYFALTGEELNIKQ